MQEVPQKQPLSVIGPPFLPLSRIASVPGFHGLEDPEAIFELTRKIGKGYDTYYCNRFKLVFN